MTVLFKNKKFILLGTLETGGPMFDSEGYVPHSPHEWGEYYLFSDGTIKRLGTVVGHSKDLKVYGTTR